MSEHDYEVRLAYQLYRQGRYSDAEAAFRLALVRHAKDAKLHLALAYCIPMDERPDEALSCYRRAAELDPYSADAHNGIGMCEEDLERAEAAFREAVRLTPDSAEFHNNLAVCLMRQDRLEDAEACFRRSYTINPQDLTCAADWAELLIELGRFRDAEGVYRRAVKSAGDRRKLLERRAWWYYAEGRHGEAEKNFLLQRKGPPESTLAWIYCGWGRVLKKQRKLGAAIDAFRIAVGLSPRIADMHAELASALEDAKLPDQAGVAYRRAEDLAMESAKAHS